MHGYGYHTNHEGDKYLGGMTQNNRQNEGEELLKDKTRFKGIFKDNNRQGKGQLITKHNRVVNGMWNYGNY